MRFSHLLVPLPSVALCFVLVNGCGSDSSDAGATPDGSTVTLDSGSPTDGATSNPGTDAHDAGTADADAAPTTNDATWTAAAGLPDTACTPWVLTDTANPEDPVIADDKLTIGTSADGENIYYRQTDLVTPAELVIEVRVQLVSGAGSVASRGPVFVGFHYGSEKRKNMFFLTDGAAFLLTEENTKGASATVATTDAMHTYKIVTNTTTHAIEVFRDNVSILTGTAFPEAEDPGAVTDILWGEASIGAHGVSMWESVKHNAHSPTTCP